MPRILVWVGSSFHLLWRITILLLCRQSPLNLHQFCLTRDSKYGLVGTDRNAIWQYFASTWLYLALLFIMSIKNLHLLKKMAKNRICRFVFWSDELIISFFFLLTQFMNSPFRELRVLQKLILQLFEWPCFVPQLFAVIPSSHAYKKNPDFMSFLSFKICTELAIIRSCSKVKKSKWQHVFKKLRKEILEKL